MKYPKGARISIHRIALESPRGVATLEIDYHIVVPNEDPNNAQNEIVYQSGTMVIPMKHIVDDLGLDVDKIKEQLDTSINQIALCIGAVLIVE